MRLLLSILAVFVIVVIAERRNAIGLDSAGELPDKDKFAQFNVTTNTTSESFVPDLNDLIDDVQNANGTEGYARFLPLKLSFNKSYFLIRADQLNFENVFYNVERIAAEALDEICYFVGSKMIKFKKDKDYMGLLFVHAAGKDPLNLFKCT